MRRIGYIAAREFLGTVLTRGFIVGVMIMPALVALTFVLGPRLMNQRGEPVRGQIIVIDPTGAVTAELRTAIAPQAIAARRSEAVTSALLKAAEVPLESARAAVHGP